MRRLAIATALTVAFAGVAAAQTVATPVYLAPYRAFTDYEIGGAFSAPGGGVAIEGAYRYGMDRFDIGFRLGLFDGDGDNINALLAGVEARTRILEHSEDFPLDGALMAGIGTQLGDGYDGGIGDIDGIAIGLSWVK